MPMTIASATMNRITAMRILRYLKNMLRSLFILILHLNKIIENASHIVPEVSVYAQKLRVVAASAADSIRHTTVLSVQNYLDTVQTYEEHYRHTKNTI